MLSATSGCKTISIFFSFEDIRRTLGADDVRMIE